MYYIPVDFLDELNAQLSLIETSDSKLCGRMEVYVFKSMGHQKRLYKQLERQYLEDQQARQIALTCQISGDEQQQQPLQKTLQDSTAENTEIPNQLAADSNSPALQQNQLQPESSEDEPFGPMNDANSRKLHFFLISTLNMAFPDYEFSSVKASHFRKHNLPDIAHHINSILDSNSLKSKFWHAMEDAIGPNGLPNVADSSSPDSSKNADESLRIQSSNSAENNIINGQYKRKRRDSSFATTYKTPTEWEQDVEVYSYEPDNSSGAGDPYEDDYEDGNGGTVWRFYYFFFNRKLKRILFFTMKAVSIVDDGSAVSIIGANGNENNSLDYESLPDDESDENLSLPDTSFSEVVDKKQKTSSVDYQQKQQKSSSNIKPIIVGAEEHGISVFVGGSSSTHDSSSRPMLPR